VAVVVLLSSRVRTDGRPWIRILKDGGRETAVAKTNSRVRGGVRAQVCDVVIRWCNVVNGPWGESAAGGERNQRSGKYFAGPGEWVE
jgi:hypothetical protein